MGEDKVTTGVDDLLNYLEDKDKVSLKDAAKDLKIPEETLQLWVDFLVEERILGTEYKFTKPFIYLNKKQASKKQVKKTSKKRELKDFKKEYIENAVKKKISEEKAEELWKQHLEEAIDKLEEYFYREAKKRNLNNPKDLFGVYKRKLVEKERSTETQ
ncbi:MAG: hypothetical protein ACLFTH_03225 [Candidatus Woesearchaeota archaeon]